jgi:hypothetical protein
MKVWPEPQPGLVISYSYLWHGEHIEGPEEGIKDRPCAIVAALAEIDGSIMAYVLPVTHTKPADMDAAVEIPPKVKRHLGLDDEPSWVIVSEWNQFTWPGPDLRRAPGRDERSAVYGFLPDRLFQQIKDRFFAYVQARRGLGVKRTT